jgi:hypothetical protein
LASLIFGCAPLAIGIVLPAPAAGLPLEAAPMPQARVVVVENPQAMVAFEPQPDKVREMVNQGMLKLTGKSDLGQAWRGFVSTQDVVGLKVVSAPGPRSGTRPAVVAPVIEGLLQAGLPPRNIIIWDRQLVDLRRAGFNDLARRYGVRLAGATGAGYDEKVFYDNELMGDLVAGDFEFDHTGAKSGRKSYVSQLLTKQITKIITISPLLNHNLAGVCGNLYSLAMGSVDNTTRFASDARSLARAVPEIYALPVSTVSDIRLGDHVVLSITDALIGQYEGQRLSLLHYSTELNQIWLSKDPVALDVLAIQELDNERVAAKMEGFNQNPELYHNASLLELGVSDPARIRTELVK